MEIDINLTWILLFLMASLACFLIHSGFGTRLFVKKDEKIAEKFLDKFPLVSPDFYRKPQPEQLAENNQEIHEINKRLDDQDKRIEHLEKYVKNTLDKILEEIAKKNG